MSDEKGGSIVFILIVLVCGILWSNQPSTPKADFTQPVDGLIDEVASVEHSLNHSVDANKMVDPSPSDKPKAKPEIIIFTSSSCPPCEKWKRCEAPKERWKRCEAPKFEANGWKVAYCEDHPYPRTPTFLITENGRTIEKVGYFTFEELREVLK